MQKSRFAALACGLLAVSVLACQHQIRQRNVEIVARTEVTGAINGAALRGHIVATVNTGRGGRSTCEFSQLPNRFTAATLGTHT